MKKTKLLSFLLAGALLFHTTGIDALATASTEPLPAAETVQEPSDETSAPLPEEDGEKQNPGEKEEAAPDPEAPGEGGEKAEEPETPGEDEEAPAPGTEEAPEQPEDENTQPPAKEAVPEEEQTPEESVSENSVSENTISENTLPEEEESAFDIFPGLGDDYTFSAQQIADKQELSAHVGDIISQDFVRADRFPDAEGLYELGEVVYLADTETEATQIAEAFGGKLDSYSYGVAVISLPEKATVSMAVAAAADLDVKLPAVWPNYYSYADEEVSPDAYYYDPSTKDPGYKNQWQHDYIGTRYAWSAGYKGQGVKVAVIDSGIQEDHEDIKAAAGKNFCGGAAGTAYNVDNGSHGTHVAGIIGAVAENNKGGAGIAPQATVRSYCVMTKASGGKSGSGADIMRAVNAAVSDGNDIINMSLGGPMYSGQYAQVIDNAYKKGVAVFAAAGNDDSDAYHFPAAYPGAISVAAVDENGARAYFSCFGSTIKLAFPGYRIYSTIPSGYGYMNGTSQATPAAAGTAAVILSADESIRKKSGKARVDALLSKMRSSTTKSSGSGMGAGTTWLPGVLKIATDATAPDAPEITFTGTTSPKDRTGKTFIAEAVTVQLTKKTAANYIEIYYSTDGKSPSYKNGVANNAVLYNGAFSLGGAKSKTVKAIAVNTRTGLVSKAASKSCTLTPIPTAVAVASTGNVSRVAAGKSLKLTATVTPSYAISNKVAWSVDEAAGTAGITVSNGTVKTKTTTPPGKYAVTATAVGSDGASFNGATGTYVFEVIAKADIQKVAFLDANGKAFSKYSLNRSETLDLKDYLKVTKLDHSAGTAADVVWSSSNPKAATVTADGILKAVAPGKAVIKATSNDGGNKNASCTVTVNQPVESITLSGPVKVAAGKSITLSANVAPKNATNKNLTWTAAGNDLVTVSAKGTVSAKKEATGSCTVTATAKDGSAVSSAAYTITVMSGSITNITLSDKSVTLFSNKATSSTPDKKTLTAAVTGSGSFDDTLIEWKSSAPGIASVENGIVTAHTAGKATITCAATDGSGKKATCTVTVAIPMSKLVISTTGRSAGSSTNSSVGYLAQGKSVRLSAKYYSYCGKPTNTKVIWRSSNEDIVKVDKNGKVTANKNAEEGSIARISAMAADGSNLVSNNYLVCVSPLYKKMTLEFDTRPSSSYAKGGFVPVLDDGYTSSYFTVSVSGGKNTGCNKAVYQNASNSFYYLQPLPGAATTKKSSSSKYITSRDLQKLKLTVTLQDGSDLKATTTVYAARFSNGTVAYYTPKRK